MLKDRRERNGLLIVVGISLAAAVWLQMGRGVRAGLPGDTTSRPSAAAPEQGNRSLEDGPKTQHISTGRGDASTPTTDRHTRVRAESGTKDSA